MGVTPHLGSARLPDGRCSRLHAITLRIRWPSPLNSTGRWALRDEIATANGSTPRSAAEVSKASGRHPRADQKNHPPEPVHFAALQDLDRLQAAQALAWRFQPPRDEFLPHTIGQRGAEPLHLLDPTQSGL